MGKLKNRQKRLFQKLHPILVGYVVAEGLLGKNDNRNGLSWARLCILLEQQAGLRGYTSETPFALRIRTLRAAYKLKLVGLGEVPMHLRQHVAEFSTDVVKRALRKDKRDFYRSLPWKKLRYAFLSECHARGAMYCRACGVLDGPFQVDHIKPVSAYWDLRLERSNLQLLCADCNWGKLNQDQTDWRTEEDRAVGVIQQRDVGRASFSYWRDRFTLQERVSLLIKRAGKGRFPGLDTASYT
jgi:5-methylcytosine-specific restriction endonuclease McrA